MTSVLRRMQFRLPDSDFLDSRPATRSDLIAKKVAGIFPKRSIWRSLGLDYSNSPSENGGSLSCLARAARELPQLVKRACSPSSYLATSSQLSSPAPEPPKRPASASSRIRLSAPGRLSPPPTALHTNAPPGPPADRSAIRHAVSRLADITPVLERYGQLSNSASPSKITFLSQPLSLLSTQSPASATENRAPSPLFRRSLSPNSRLHGQSAEMASVKRLRRESLSSTRQRDASTSPLPPSAPLFSRPFLTTSSYYYQPEFDSLDWSTSTCLSADASSSESIEIPSWRVHDLLANYATDLGPSKFLRPRPSFTPPTNFIKSKKSSPTRRSSAQRSATLPTRHLRRNTTKVTRHPRNQHHHDRSKGTQLHADSGGNAADNAESEEDTDDAAYQLRHSKLEIEEIKRERVSHQRMVEEELRSRLERRDLESWVRLITCSDYICVLIFFCIYSVLCF
uniref:PEHE domain n=1 Tax=Schistocephalus solidus TaxID=70667 RepID=A0A0X3NZG2_SCHSO